MERERERERERKRGEEKIKKRRRKREREYIRYTSKRMQQMCRGGTDWRGVPCAMLIPLCAPHFHAIPESVPSCKAPQSKDCGAFPRIAALFP